MPVIVRMDPDAVARPRVCLAPFAESILALHVLVEPGHHPHQHPFVRRMRELPASFRADLGRCADTFRHPAETLINPQPEPTADVAEALAALAGLADVGAVDERAVGVVANFWELAFAREWESIRPVLETAADDLAAAVEREGMLGLISDVAPWIAASPARHELQFACTASEDAGLPDPVMSFDGRGRPVTIAPSLFAAPHVYVDAETPAAVQFLVPIQPVVPEASPPPGLAAGLAACATEPRLRLLRALAGRPRTVQELAPMLSMAPSTASRHLTVLAEHGLVTGERDGWYVLYRLEPHRVAELTADLESYLSGDG